MSGAFEKERRRGRRRIGLGVIAAAAALALAPRPAAAEPSVADRTLAETLFREGRRLMADGKVAEACAKLEESQRLDPKDGTLLNLALCREQEGKTASAWTLFQEALAAARTKERTGREKLAQEHIDALEPKLSRITLNIPPEAQREGLDVRVDGVSIPKAAWGTPFPVDPGARTITARAPGRATWTARIQVRKERDRKVITIPALPEDRPAGASPASPPPPELPADAAPPPEGGLGTQRVIGLVVGGVGVAAIGVGAVFGVLAITKENEADDACGSPISCPDAAALALSEDARTFATVANVGIGAGLACVAAGALLLLTAPSEPPQRGTWILPAIGPAGGGVALRTAW